MRPLIHPSIDDVTLEGILHALSDPARAAIYAQLAASDGAATCSTFINVIDREIPKSTLSHHLAQLVAVQLLTQSREGRVLRCRVDAGRARLMQQFINGCCEGLPD